MQFRKKKLINKIKYAHVFVLRISYEYNYIDNA